MSLPSWISRSHCSGTSVSRSFFGVSVVKSARRAEQPLVLVVLDAAAVEQLDGVEHLAERFGGDLLAGIGAVGALGVLRGGRGERERVIELIVRLDDRLLEERALFRPTMRAAMMPGFVLAEVDVSWRTMSMPGLVCLSRAATTSSNPMRSCRRR